MRKELGAALSCFFVNQPRHIHAIASSCTSIAALITRFEELPAIQALTPSRRQKLLVHLNTFNMDRFEDTLQKHNMHMMFIDDPEYPENLREISDAPYVLYTRGNMKHLKHDNLAVVGPRHMTQYGEKVTEALVKALCPYLMITSGLAMGVDGKAHTTALDAGYPTIAVVGTGLDIAYPSEHRELTKRIAQDGLLISEYPPGTRAFAANFPQRNRIVSGLSRGVLVVEASPKSGSLITARLAMEQNRDVFAVPGPIFSESSIGTHQLIQDGAKLTMHAQDVLDELSFLIKPPPQTPPDSVTEDPLLSEDEQQVITALHVEPLTIDGIMDRTQLSISQALQTITFLELQHLIEKTSSDHYKIKT